MTVERPSRPWRVAYLVTHPIQYQVPLLRRITADPDVELTAFFESDFSIQQHVDPEFGVKIEWDVPLLGDYRHVFLAQQKDGIGKLLADGRFDALWVHGYSYRHHMQAMLQAKMKGLKVLLRDEMADAGRERSASRFALKKGLFTFLDKMIDGYLTIGTRNEQHCYALGIDRERMFRMAYTVDNRWFQARLAEAAPNREELRRSLGLEAGRPIILYVAKLIARKAPLDLLKAFANLQGRTEAGRPYLLMAGDGDMHEELKTFVREHDLHDAKLLGFKNQREVAALYDLCDLFVLPSARESWGLVVNEVMNAGRAVITSDRVCAAADLIHSGRNGDVYPFGDIDRLTQQMQECLASPERLASFGHESRRIIETWDYEQNVVGLKAALASTAGVRLAA